MKIEIIQALGFQETVMDEELFGKYLYYDLAEQNKRYEGVQRIEQFNETYLNHKRLTWLKKDLVYHPLGFFKQTNLQALKLPRWGEDATETLELLGDLSLQWYYASFEGEGGVEGFDASGDFTTALGRSLILYIQSTNFQPTYEQFGKYLEMAKKK